MHAAIMLGLSTMATTLSFLSSPFSFPSRSGAVDVVHDSNLTPIQTPDSPSKSSSAIIPAVVVPIVVVACLLVAGAWWYRRRKLAGGAGGFGEADSLTAPLGGSSVAGSAASGSGVHLRFPGSS